MKFGDDFRGKKKFLSKFPYVGQLAGFAYETCIEISPPSSLVWLHCSAVEWAI